MAKAKRKLPTNGTCKICGNSFVSVWAGGCPKVYCSRKCKNKEDCRLRRLRHPDRVKDWWTRTNYRKVIQERNAAIRKLVLEHYGDSRCQCCGESGDAFLTIDHIHGGGRKHRKEIRVDFYAWLMRNNYPDGFRVLCMNCNWAMRAGKLCPHQKEKNAAHQH
jgi:hypothetical protein